MSHIRDNLSHMCHFVTHVGPEATTGIPARSRRFAGPGFPGPPGTRLSIFHANAISFRKNLSGIRCWHALCLCRRQPPQALPSFRFAAPFCIHPLTTKQEPCQPLPLSSFYIIFTGGFLPKEKPPRAQTPRGFRPMAMTRVLPGKCFQSTNAASMAAFPASNAAWFVIGRLRPAHFVA